MKELLWVELKRTLRQPQFVIFAVIMPVAMYLIFGGMKEATGQVLPSGANVTAIIMVQMAFYLGVLAAANTGADAGVQRANGWMRTLALTPMRDSQYTLVRLALVYVTTLVPITIVYLSGAVSYAKMTPGQWVVSYILCVLLSGLFGAFGQMIGSLTGAAGQGLASGLVVLLSFASDLFVPLEGTLSKVSQFMPLFGSKSLVTWQLTQGHSTTGVSLSLTWVVVNAVVWGVLMIVGALYSHRLTKSRA